MIGEVPRFDADSRLRANLGWKNFRRVRVANLIPIIDMVPSADQGDDGWNGSDWIVLVDYSPRLARMVVQCDLVLRRPVFPFHHSAQSWASECIEIM